MTKDELLNCLAENVARERILTNITLEKKLLEQKEEHVYKQLLESAFDFMPENHLFEFEKFLDYVHQGKAETIEECVELLEQESSED